MNCFRHGVSMVKDTLTGIFTCFKCDEDEKVFEALHDRDILEAQNDEEIE